MASNGDEVHDVDLERGDPHAEGILDETEGHSAITRAVDVARNYGSQISTDRIWALYNAKSEKHDTLLASRLKGSMDSILVFAGLFSAIVTAFIIESYRLLNVDSGDTTVFYLAQISRQLASQSTSPLPSIAPPPFEPSRTTVVVNILWILSLISSLGCALGATLIQSWTSRYIEVINESSDVVTRARYRAWYFHGLKKFQMENLAAAVPALLHISMFLFLAGLVVFLFPINHEVAYAAMGASIALTAVYLTLAIIQLFVKNSPYHTPLSNFMAVCVISVVVLVYGAGLLSVFIICAVVVLVVFVVGAPFVLAAEYVSTRWLGASLYSESSTPKNTKKSLKDAPLPPGPSALYSRMRGSPTEKQEEDGRALRWLLQQSTTVLELEEFIKSLEPFIDRDTDHTRSAQFVLELGGLDVECVSAKFGLALGHLLESCIQPTDLSLEHRHSRAISCTRAVISTMTYTSSRERSFFLTVNTLTPATVDHMKGRMCAIRWVYLGSEVAMTAISSMQKDKDPVLAFHAFCLSSILIHRSLSDIAYRIRSGEVQLRIPTRWDIRAMLRVTQDIRRTELHELFVAASLDPTAGDMPSGRISTSTSKPPGSYPIYSRPITLLITQQEGDDAPYKSARFPSHMFQNEATLFALYILLDHTATSVIPPSLTHLDLLKRTISALVQDGSGTETSTSLQRSFINVLMSIYAPRHIDVDGVQINPPSNSSPDSQPLDTPPTARSLLLSDDVIDLLVPIIASLDHRECSAKAKALLQEIRPGYLETIAEPTPSVHDDDKDASQLKEGEKEEPAVGVSEIQEKRVVEDSQETGATSSKLHPEES